VAEIVSDAQTDGGGQKRGKCHEPAMGEKSPITQQINIRRRIN